MDGRRLGPYEIIAPLGSGGMGEVYRARDARLDRDVAVKVLPEGLAADRERLLRFEREAKLLAALSHPNIAVVHGFEEAGGVHFLAMELVEGPTLAERMDEGPIGLDEALEIGRQIAEALEAAHEKGIVHRDLKPANVKLTPAGTVKVLDFGLAKALAPDGTPAEGSPDISASPTLVAATSAGVILGTAAYMSPEQARGQAVDRRADIWAFGVMMHELVSGERLFAEDTVSDTLAAVLRADIDLEALPPGTPPALRRLLRRCLSRAPRGRLRDIGDARLEIEEILAGAGESESVAVAATSGGARSRAWAMAAVAGWAVVALAVAALVWQPAATAPGLRLVQFTIPPPADGTFTSTPAVSPDGGRIAYAVTQAGTSGIWIRDIADPDSAAVPNTEGGDLPFWSPDGESIGFFLDDVLYRIDPTGLDRRQLARLREGALSPAWGADDVILVGSWPQREQGSRLLRVSARGGEPRPIFEIGDDEIGHWAPRFLPDGRRFLFSKYHQPTAGSERVRRSEWIGQLDGSATLLDVVMPNPTAVVGAVDAGMLLFGRETIVAFAFDPDAEPPIAEGIPLGSQRVSFDISAAAGVLAYVTSDVGRGTRTVLFDREGREIRELTPRGNHYTPRMSSDGRLVAIEAHAADGQTVGDLEIVDVEGRRPARNLSMHPDSHDAYPVWSPDDERVFFDSTRNDFNRDVYALAANGVGLLEEVFVGEMRTAPMDLSPDGTTLLIHVEGDSWDVYSLALGGEEEPRPYLTSEHDEIQPVFSPDGHWVAYASDETGDFEIYVEAFPRSEERVARFRIAAGEAPRWNDDGTELFYLAPDDGLMSVPVTLGETVEWESPRLLFRARVRRTGGIIRDMVHYDVTPDGQRFVAVIADAGNEEIRVILNWPLLLQDR